MQAVDRMLRQSLDPDKHTIAIEVDIQLHVLGATALARISRLPIIRNDCALAIGDVLHSFRSALDYLAWDLVRIGDDPRPKRPDLIQFPMSKSGSAFKEWLPKRLPGVPDDYVAAIRQVQPYRRGERSKAIRWLRNLSDIDKHRVLLPTVMNASDINLTVLSNWPIAWLEYLHREPGPLHVGTNLMRVQLAPGAGQCQMNVQGDFRVFPSLGYKVPIMDRLMAIRNAVFDVLTLFDDLI